MNRNKKIIRSVDFINPAGTIGDVSVKLPKRFSNFLFSGFRIIGRPSLDHWHCKVSNFRLQISEAGLQSERVTQFLPHSLGRSHERMYTSMYA
jgi:hypothetical protein